MILDNPALWTLIFISTMANGFERQLDAIESQISLSGALGLRLHIKQDWCGAYECSLGLPSETGRFIFDGGSQSVAATSLMSFLQRHSHRWRVVMIVSPFSLFPFADLFGSVVDDVPSNWRAIRQLEIVASGAQHSIPDADSHDIFNLPAGKVPLPHIPRHRLFYSHNPC